MKIKTFIRHTIESVGHWSVEKLLDKSVCWVGPESVEHRSSLEVLSCCTITVNENGAVNSCLEKQTMILCSGIINY